MVPGSTTSKLVLSGRYRSTTGMGLGILSARRLMEPCAISTGPTGNLDLFAQAVARDPADDAGG